MTMSRVGANNAVEIITFLVLAVIWIAVQVLNRSARKPPPPPRDTGRPKPESPPESPEDELRRFFEQLARSAEDEAEPAPDPSPAPSATRPPPPPRVYTAPPPVPTRAEETRPDAPPWPARPASTTGPRDVRKRRTIPFARQQKAPLPPPALPTLDATEAAGLAGSLHKRMRAGSAVGSRTVPLRMALPPLHSMQLRTSPTNSSAALSPAAALLMRGDRRQALRNAVIWSAIIGAPRALAPAGRDLPHGD